MCNVLNTMTFQTTRRWRLWALSLKGEHQLGGSRSKCNESDLVRRKFKIGARWRQSFKNSLCLSTIFKPSLQGGHCNTKVLAEALAVPTSPSSNLGNPIMHNLLHQPTLPTMSQPKLHLLVNQITPTFLVNTISMVKRVTSPLSARSQLCKSKIRPWWQKQWKKKVMQQMASTFQCSNW